LPRVSACRGQLGIKYAQFKNTSEVMDAMAQDGARGKTGYWDASYEVVQHEDMIHSAHRTQLSRMYVLMLLLFAALFIAFVVLLPGA